MEKHIIIGADASDFGLAAVLSQEQFGNCKPNEDTEPKKDSVTDSASSDTEKPETEEVVVSERPVGAVHTKNIGTEQESSVRESLAEKQQSDSEFGLLVKLTIPKRKVISSYQEVPDDAGKPEGS